MSSYYIKHWFSPLSKVKEQYFYSEEKQGWTTDRNEATQYCCGKLPFILKSLEGLVSERRGTQWFSSFSPFPLMSIEKVPTPEEKPRPPCTEDS